MYWLEVEVPTDDSVELDDAALATLQRFRAQWVERIWEPYRTKRGAQRTLLVDITMHTHDVSETFLRERIELQTTAQLFDQLLDVYMSNGLRCVYDVFRSVNGGASAGGVTLHTRDFINKSIAFLEELIASQLLQLQGDATQLALRETKQQLQRVTDAKACFEKRHDHYRELYLGRLKREGAIPIGAKDRLYELFQKYFDLRRRINNLQKDINDCDQKDGGGDRDKIAKARAQSPTRQARVNISLVPQRKLIKQLLATRAEVMNLFPHAAFVLEELEEDIRDHLPIPKAAKASDATYRRSRDIELKYDSKIFYFLFELEHELNAVLTSLSNPGARSHIFEYLRKDVRDRIVDAGGLHEWVQSSCLSQRPGIASYVENGIRYGIGGVYFTAAERDRWALTNRVLGRVSVLSRLEEQRSDLMPGWRTVVLKQYRIDLERTLALLSAAGEQSRQRWHYVEVVVAIAGLIVAAISIPFGAGAVGVPAGVTLALSVLQITLLLAGLVLMVHAIVELIAANLTASDELQEKLIELGQQNPKALREVAATVARNHEQFKAATSGLVLEVIKLAAAHKLRPIAFALDIEGYLNDVEFIQGSLGMAMPDEEEDDGDTE